MIPTTATILHLEDNDLDAELVCQRLRKSGLNVELERVVDRGGFLEKLKSKPYDLVLSDFQIPGFEGLEALSLEREYQPDTPFIFVSGAMGEDVAVEALKQGATDYVLKERLIRLPSAVERALAESCARAERKAAEEAFREQQKLFRTTLASIGDGVISLDDDRRVVFLNAVAEDLTGWKTTEATGQPVSEVLHLVSENDHQVQIAPHAAAAHAPGPARSAVLIAKHGAKRSIEFSEAPLRDDFGKVIGVVLVFRDISARRLAEASLLASEERFEFICRTTGVGFWYCDLPFDVLSWDENVKEHFFLAPDATVTIDLFFELLHPEDREPTRNAIQAAIRDRAPYDMDYRTVDPMSGRQKWVRAIGRTVYATDGTPQRFDGVTLDITQRKLAEEGIARLLADEKRHSKLLARVAEASRSINTVLSIESIGHILTEEGRTIIGAEEAAVLLDASSGGSPPLFVASSANESWQGASDAQHKIAEELLAEMRRDAYPRRSRAGNPKLRVSVESDPESYDVLAAPLIGHGGGVLGAIVLFDKHAGPFTAEDESVLSQLAAIAAIGLENARLYDSLRDQDRRKDEFLATLAHELRNPLAPVRTGLEILKVEPDPDRGRLAREIMERQLRHMVRLIDDLLDVSRVSRGKVELKRELVSMRTVVDLAMETSLPLLQSAGHNLSITIGEGPLELYGDLTRLAQVLSNLLNNAAKYTQDGGQIELEVRRAGDEIITRVSDSGMGIPPNMLPKVFDLFTQVGRTIDRSQGGLGIGLSLVKRLVELHGGSVVAESAGLGQGSAFIVHLPAASQVSAGSRGVIEPNREGEADCSRLRILVVDDNLDGAQTLEMLLRTERHETRCAHSGPAALQSAREFLPEIVFLDIGLPGLNGYEVASQIRNDPTFGHPMLIAVTGWGSEEDRKRAKEAGFDVHLTKPVEVSALRNVLARPLVRAR